MSSPPKWQPCSYSQRNKSIPELCQTAYRTVHLSWALACGQRLCRRYGTERTSSWRSSPRPWDRLVELQRRTPSSLSLFLFLFLFLFPRNLPRKPNPNSLEPSLPHHSLFSLSLYKFKLSLSLCFSLIPDPNLHRQPEENPAREREIPSSIDILPCDRSFFATGLRLRFASVEDQRVRAESSLNR